VEASVHEHIARAMYYFGVHLLFASIVGSAAWILTSIRGASSTGKYWIWVVTSFNFFVPVAAVTDKLWASHFTWAAPLGAIGGPVWNITQGRTAVVLAALWTVGAISMLMRLISRICREHREVQANRSLSGHGRTAGFLVDGIAVSFDNRHAVPAVRGILHPHILLPIGIDRVLSRQEFDAVLLHEVVHAKRRDNLIRLLYELSLCALWFHPLVWLAGTRMAVYRELSCDESVIRHAHGQALVSALAKFALPERSLFLHATASSHLSHRLARLGQPPLAAHRAASVLLTSLFAAVMVAGVFETIAHTACCFILKR
jgi:beta-lactamase regulating signal transducer with metallopeptidase domain